MWPVLKEDFQITQDNISLDALHFLLIVQRIHPNVLNNKYFKTFWKTNNLFDNNCLIFYTNILWNIKSTITINHPFYEFFIEYIVRNKKVIEFWQVAVPIVRKSEIKHKDITALRMIISLLNNQEITSEMIVGLLSKDFIHLIIQKLREIDQLSEDVQELYNEFLDTLIKSYEKLTAESDKLEIFQRLINPPSSILIEKLVFKSILQNLINTMNSDSLETVTETLKEIIVSEPEVENIGGPSKNLHAAHFLQKILSNRTIANNLEWRCPQLKFFLNLGIFNSKDGDKLLRKSTDNKLSANYRNILFHSLEYRFPKLEDEKKVLTTLVQYCNEILNRKNSEILLQYPLSDESLNVWKKMYTQTFTTDNKKSTKSKERLNTVFHVLLLHMGLHLFNDPTVAHNSIEELEKVMSRLQTNPKVKNNRNKQLNPDAEPEWIEVVVDLFLNLLSQNSTLLRNIVGHVFPHLCGEINLTAFNQILSVLDLKDNNNPLSFGDETEEEESSSEDEDAAVKTNGKKSNKIDTSDVDEEDEDDSDEDDEDDDDDVEDEVESDEEDDAVKDKLSDKVRSVIHTALGLGSTETDQESVDLDDMSEEEGKKIDEALSQAFQMLKRSKKKKMTKAEKINELTLNNFRMRVFDLIDIYLKQQPDIHICVEIILFVFEMLPLAMKEDKYKQILKRFYEIFNKLIKIRKFRENNESLKQKYLSELLSDLLQKVGKGVDFPNKTDYLLKASQFLIKCSQILSKENPNDKEQMTQVFQEYLTEFFTHRNPSLTLNIFNSIYSLQWEGNWKLAQSIVKNGLLQPDLRNLRREQALHFLRTIYKNRNLILSDLKETSKFLKSIENSLNVYIAGKDSVLSLNEFNELIQLVVTINNVHKSNPTLKTHMKWNPIMEVLQNSRKNLVLNGSIMNYYKQMCGIWKLDVITNDKVERNGNNPVKNKKVMNNQNSNGVVLTNGGANGEKTEEKTNKKRKNKGKDSMKEKRLKKEERLKLASEGLNENVTFL